MAVSTQAGCSVRRISASPRDAGLSGPVGCQGRRPNCPVRIHWIFDESPGPSSHSRISPGPVAPGPGQTPGAGCKGHWFSPLFVAQQGALFPGCHGSRRSVLRAAQVSPRGMPTRWVHTDQDTISSSDADDAGECSGHPGTGDGRSWFQPGAEHFLWKRGWWRAGRCPVQCTKAWEPACPRCETWYATQIGTIEFAYR